MAHYVSEQPNRFIFYLFIIIIIIIIILYLCFYSPSVDLYRYGISQTIVHKSVRGICHNTTSKVCIDTYEGWNFNSGNYLFTNN